MDHECTFERSCLAVVSTYRSPQGIQCTGPGQRCLISTEMRLVWTQGHHHHLQYKPLLPAHIASQDRYKLHEVTPRLNKSVGSQSLCCLAVQSPGVSKISEYLGLNRRAESHHGLQGGGTAVISLVFPPKSSYCIPTSLISLQLGTENTLPPLETAQRTIDVPSSKEASLQKSKPFVLI